jgi:hypothetical protein
VEKGWRDGPSTTIDVVVATSAFGLGSDQPDVRAVVHAALPETASRFYQEIGRGGRDGRATVSLLLDAPGDRREALHLARRTYPGQTVRTRWDSMFANRVTIEEPSWSWLDLSDLHPALRGRAAFDSERNREWNRRVLALLQQAQLIRLETPVTSAPPEGLSHPIGVRLLRHDADGDDWDDAWKVIRVTGRDQAILDHEALLDLLEGKSCLGRVLSSVFTRDGVVPVPNCAGCPWCREHGVPPRSDEAKVVALGAEDAHSRRDEIVRATGGGNVLAVVPERGSDDAVRRLLEWAGSERSLVARYDGSGVGGGMAAPRGPAVVRGDLCWVSVPGSTEIVQIDPTESPRRDLLTADGAVGRVLIVTATTPSFERPERSLLEFQDVPTTSLSTFMAIAR